MKPKLKKNQIGKLLSFGVKKEKKSIIQIFETKNNEYGVPNFKK